MRAVIFLKVVRIFRLKIGEQRVCYQFQCKVIIPLSKNKMMEFEVQGDFITLSQLLKVLNVAESGAHAFQMIDDGVVKLNNEVEMRRRKKLRRGDVVELFGERILLK